MICYFGRCPLYLYNWLFLELQKLWQEPHFPTAFLKVLKLIPNCETKNLIDLVTPKKKKGGAQPHTMGGGGECTYIQAQGPCKSSTGPETTLSDFTSTNEGFLVLLWTMATTSLIVGFKHRSSYRSLMPPKFPASGGRRG